MATTMTLGDALLYSLLGILVVFFALALLMCIILIMTAVGDRAEKKEALAAGGGASAAPVPARAAEPVPAPAAEPAPGAAGELKLYNTEPRAAAMIMAIIADELQTPLNELRFLSIREIGESPRSEKKQGRKEGKPAQKKGAKRK